METITSRQAPNNVVELVLNRPQMHNALNALMIQELSQTLHTLGKDDTLRALVIRAEGPSFSAGADLKWMEESATYPFEENVAQASALSIMLHRLYTFPAPTIALVQGKTLGGGLGILSCVDIVIAEQSAGFSFSELKLGLVPAIISPYVIQAIGARQAQRYFLTAEFFDAPAAQSLGLIHEVVEEGKLPEAGAVMLGHILKGAPGAARTTKTLVSRIRHAPLDAGTRQETIQCIAQVRASNEAKAGLAAFFAKQPPQWVQALPPQSEKDAHEN